MSESINHNALRNKRFLTGPIYAAENERLTVASHLSVVVVKYRTVHGLSQTDFAERLGWDVSVVDQVESGEHLPSPSVLHDLSDAGVIGKRDTDVIQVPTKQNSI